MSWSKRDEVYESVRGTKDEDQLDPLHEPEKAETPAISRQRSEELVEFMEEAEKSVNRFDLRSGFYSKDDQTTPRHVVDQEDLERHRTAHFHTHHPMSVHAQFPRSPKKRHGKRRHRRRSKSTSHRSPQFKPSMDGLQESDSESQEDEDGEAEEEGEEEADGYPASQEPQGEPYTSSAPEEQPEAPEESKGKEEEEKKGKGEEGDGGGGGSVQGETPVSFFVGEAEVEPQEEVPTISLRDILSGESSTDPDPGVQSIDAKRGHYKTPTPDYKDGSAPKVTFVLGEDTPETPELEEKKTETPKKGKSEHGQRKHHHHHHHHHRHHNPDLKSRRHLGSEVEITGLNRSLPTEQDEARTLSGVDLDDMTSHRFGESMGVRRRKHHNYAGMASVVHIGQKKAKVPPSVKAKPDIDHSPHEMFVELEELNIGESADFEWQETARWIKYEEDVEAESTRFGKPHVASLSFHSLLELRQVLAQGVVLLDLENEDFPSIVSRVVNEMVLNDQLSPDSMGAVIRVLLLKHKHVHRSGTGFLQRSATHLNFLSGDRSRGSFKGGSLGSFRNLTNFFRSGSGGGSSSRKISSTTDAQIHINGDATDSVGDSTKANKDNVITMPDVIIEDGQPNKPAEGHVKVDIKPSDPNLLRRGASDVSLRSHGEIPNILRRIPKDAEATSVLVGSVDFLDEPIMAFVRLAKGCDLGNITEVPLPVRFIFILMGPSDSIMNYHEIGRSISTLMANVSFHDMAYRAEDRRTILDAINDFLDDSIVLPPGDWDKKTLLPIMSMAREKAKAKKAAQDEKKPPPKRKEDDSDDPLKRTGRLFGGFVNDIRRRYPKYLSDIKDGLNFQCLATFFFIYFACLSPAITFGGLLSEKIDDWMGVSELLIMTSVCGILFALLAGQPLLIVGFTGPIVVFEEGLYQFCQSTGMDYMPFRVWVCLWVFVISVIVVCVEGSFFVRYFTRFSMEIFAALISLIFIYEVFFKLYKVFLAHPLQEHYPYLDGLPLNASSSTNDTFPLTTESPSNMTIGNHTGSNEVAVTKMSEPPKPNTALLSVILTLGTFFIAYFLKQFRNSKFLGRSARRALGDFGIPIAIAVMVVVDYLIEDTYTQKLNVPEGGVNPTSDKRGWFINPLGITKSLPVWAYFAAVIPGLLVFILIFMESQITGMIVSGKSKKGTGFHLDLLLIGSFSIMAGLLGMPLLTVATVRSVSHVSSLSVMSRTHAPGEPPKLEGVREQRMTGLAVHIMIGVSVLLGKVLKQVPLAVLFGVFLYMGIASMSGVQLFDRLELFFMPVKHHPEVGYVKRVRTMKMHAFTLIQLLGLIILWVVKSTQAALAFPFFLLLLVPLRLQVLTRFFSVKELKYLDGDGEDESDQEEEELDFYHQAHMPI